MQVVKSIVRRLQSRQERPAQVTPSAPMLLTPEQLKKVAGGLPRAGGWGETESIVQKLSPDA